MSYALRDGIEAKQVYIHITDAVLDDTGAVGLNTTRFTGNAFDLFHRAYYGDLTLNSLTYGIVDLGFDGTAGDVSQNFQTQAYDTIAAVTTVTLTMTTNTGMTVDAHNYRYVIVRKQTTGVKWFYRVVDTTASTIVVDRDAQADGIAANDTIALLKVPFGLTMSNFFRIDHVATDFSLTPATRDTEDTFMLGTSDSAGSQNQASEVQPFSKVEGSVTIRGGVLDLMRLMYGTAGTVPTGRTRYVMGSASSVNCGILIIWTTTVGDTDASNQITQALFINDPTIKNGVGIGDVSGDGRAEATLEFDAAASQCYCEVITAQVNDSTLNV